MSAFAGELKHEALEVARSIGDIRYVGFSKRVRDGVFAGRDTWLFSPLCALIAILALVLART